MFFASAEAVIKLQRAADDITDKLLRIERGIGHLKHELDLLQFLALAIAQSAFQFFAVEDDIAARRRQHAGHDARQRGFSAAGFTDDSDNVSILDADVDVFQDRNYRFAVDDAAVTGGHVPDFYIIYHAIVITADDFTLACLRLRADRLHQAPGIGVARMVDDLVGAALFHDLTAIQHDDVVGHLRHHGEVVGYVDRGRILLLDDFLECFQHLDLRGHVEGGSRFVQHHQVGLAAQRHGRHQAL